MSSTTSQPAALVDSVDALVRESARTNPGGLAVIFRDLQVTWSAMDERVNQAAHAFRSLGLDPGDRVVIALGNVLDFPMAYFGALRAGLVAVPVNPGLASDELVHVLADCRARAAVTTTTGASQVLPQRDRLPDLDVLLVAEALRPIEQAVVFERLLNDQPTTPVDSTRTGEDLAVLLYTSGTTGRPRAAMLSHRALLANLDQMAAIAPPVLEADDRVLVVVPVFHVYGLNAGLGMAARFGACVVLDERFEPESTLALIARWQATVVLAVPPVYTAWSLYADLGQAFATVRLALSGAAPLPASTLLRFLDVTGRHIFEGYGLTETAPTVTSTLVSVVAKPNSIGRAVPGVELVLRGEDGRPVEAGDPGEIVVRGANLFSGYWPDGRGGPDADGWWSTGDVAIADEDGDLQIVDRLTDLILVNGFNVYPAEVERVLQQHPDVLGAAVFGVPNPLTGEGVKAVLVVREGARLTEQDVLAFCEGRLARYKRPTSVEFVTTLPTTATGKVRKNVLRGAA